MGHPKNRREEGAASSAPTKRHLPAFPMRTIGTHTSRKAAATKAEGKRPERTPPFAREAESREGWGTRKSKERRAQQAAPLRLSAKVPAL
jgi:hypothetical protein